MLLSHFEHFRTTRAAILLPVYLVVTLVFDAARLRTLVSVGTSRGVTIAFAVATGIKGLVFVAENLEKGWVIRGGRMDAEVRASPRDNVGAGH